MTRPCFEAVREKKLLQFFMSRQRIMLKAGRLYPGRLRFKHHITASETDTGRVWTLYDALVDSSVLHPVHNDIKIAPFGEMSDCWIHIRWTGWDRHGSSGTITGPEWSADTDSLPEEYSKIRLMLQVLEAIQGRAEGVREKGRKLLYRMNSVPYDQRRDMTGFHHEISAFERSFNEILRGAVQELLPFCQWQHRGLLPLPFRLITIRDYSKSPYSPVKLSPSEARRLAHYIKIWLTLKSSDRSMFENA